MVQLLFARLPQFKEDLRMTSLKKLTMKGSSYDSSKQKRKKPKHHQQQTSNQNLKAPSLTTPTPVASITAAAATTINNLESSTSINTNLDSEKSKEQEIINESNNVEKEKNIDGVISDGEITTCSLSEEVIVSSATNIIDVGSSDLTQNLTSDTVKNNNDDRISQASILTTDSQQQQQADNDYVNPRGVRFVQDGANNSPAVPYGLPCVRELLRFLISLINP